MCLNRKFLATSLIVYAVFQLFQAGSSFYTVFVAYEHGLHIKFLVVFHLIAFTTSSVLLIWGASRAKPKLLFGALLFLFYKIGFAVWHFRKFYDLTFGCVDNGDDSSCDPNRLSIVYKHFFVSGMNFELDSSKIGENKVIVSIFTTYVAFLLVAIGQTIMLIIIIRKRCRSTANQWLEGSYNNQTQRTEILITN